MLINWMYELLWLAKYAQSLVTYPTSTTGNPIVIVSAPSSDLFFLLRVDSAKSLPSAPKKHSANLLLLVVYYNG